MDGQLLSTLLYGAGLALRLVAALSVAGVGAFFVLPARRTAGLLILASGGTDAAVTVASWLSSLLLPRLMSAGGLGIDNYLLISATASLGWTVLSCCATGLLVVGLWKVVRPSPPAAVA